MMLHMRFEYPISVVGLSFVPIHWLFFAEEQEEDDDETTRAIPIYYIYHRA